VVFGAEDNFLNLFAKLQALAPIMPLGGADARFQPVYVGDVAQVFVDAIDDPSTVGQVYELVGPRKYSLRELVHLAGEYSGHARPVIGLPNWIAQLQALMLELLPGPTLMSRDNLDSMTQDNVATGQYPLPLHWHATPLEAVAPDYLRAGA
jgi:NADH dehydrogenase